MSRTLKKKIKSIITQIEHDKNKSKLTESDKIELAKEMIQTQNDHHKGLLETLTETRNVCSYVMAGLVAYAGFLFNSKDFIQQTYQKLIIYSLFFIILVFWTIINRSRSLSIGIDSHQAFNFFINAKGITKLQMYTKILTKAKEEYNLLSIKFTKINKRKEYFLILSLVFFGISIIFMLIGNNPIELQIKLN